MHYRNKRNFRLFSKDQIHPYSHHRLQMPKNCYSHKSAMPLEKEEEAKLVMSKKNQPL